MKEFDNFVEIYNILGYIANCVDIVVTFHTHASYKILYSIC